MLSRYRLNESNAGSIRQEEAIMKALVDARPAEGAVCQGGPRSGHHTPTVRRRVPATPPDRRVQPACPGRAVGVQGPAVERQELCAPRIPPAALELDVRLSDRGIALVLGLASVLIVAALVCIGSTALRVTSEPPAMVTVAAG